MSETPKPPAKPAPGKQATVNDAAAIAEAGGTAVEQSTTPTEAHAAATAAMKAEADRREVELPESVIKAIADQTITALEARGAFEQPPATPVLTPAETAAPPEPSATPEPPRKKTFAEKFMGRG